MTEAPPQKMRRNDIKVFAATQDGSNLSLKVRSSNAVGLEEEKDS